MHQNAYKTEKKQKNKDIKQNQSVENVELKQESKCGNMLYLMPFFSQMHSDRTDPRDPPTGHAGLGSDP